MQALSKDIIFILGASVFLLLITLFIVVLLMAYKKRDKSYLLERKVLQEGFNTQLLQSQIEVQEQTFLQIGKELHDNVGQLLSTSRMLIGLAERSLKKPPDTLLTANATLGKAINELRTLSKSLDKEWLEQFDLVENLRTEVDRINAADTINASLTVEGTPELPSSKRIILFRIVQEAIQNAIKHGQCNNVSVGIQASGDPILILITDDGKGFDVYAASKGMGLGNMQYRTKLLGGEINYDSSSKGTAITIRIPKKTN
ncbi:MAG: sensor histidine kinase [Niabella sp.]